jgi:hypothetical protein
VEYLELSETELTLDIIQYKLMQREQKLKSLEVEVEVPDRKEESFGKAFVAKRERYWVHKEPKLPHRWAFSLPPPRSMSRQFSILIGPMATRRSGSMTQTVTDLFSAVRYLAHRISSFGNIGGTK